MKAIFPLLLLICPLAKAQIITTFAGTGASGCQGITGPATASLVWEPRNISVDANSNVYIHSWGCSQIFKVDTSGVFSIFAGDGINGYAGDGGPAIDAEFNETTCLSFAGNGDIYVSDAGNCVIRKINSAGIVSTVAGTGQCGYGGDGGPATAALLNFPNGIAMDSRGNLYIAEQFNNRVRMVNTFGYISTFAGVGYPGASGDGGFASDAALYYPCRVSVDNQDLVYIDDLGNHVIRRVNAGGLISLFAGNYQAGFSGDGGPATDASLRTPVDIVFDRHGNTYISDRTTERIRRVNPDGIITTVAGNGSAVYSGDGGPAVNAGLADPIGVATDRCGSLYISDFGDNRIRKVVMYQDCGDTPIVVCPIYIPNAFTPDRYPLNSTFAPIDLPASAANYSFSIFNRWGQRIFRTSDLNTGWNGTYHGIAADEGVYAYYIQCTIDGQSCQKKGNVTLIK